jgi:hypothetical protein
MRTRLRSPAALPHIERLLKWNLVIAIACAAMLRVSFEFSETEGNSPDGIVILAFFLAMAAAVFGLMRLKRAIALVPHRWRRILIAVASLTGQVIVLQILVSQFAP